jgi:hypothetical protein
LIDESAIPDVEEKLNSGNVTVPDTLEMILYAVESEAKKRVLIESSGMMIEKKIVPSRNSRLSLK